MGATSTNTRLRDGSAVRLRPIDASDREALRAAFDRLSPRSRYLRFLRPMDELSEAELDHLTQVDHRDHEAVIAIEPAAGELVGVARYVRSQSDRSAAEAAVAVADEWQGRGLGSALLEALVERARREHVTRFTALVQAENRTAVHVLESLGETHRSLSGPELQLDIALPERAGLGPHLAGALREAAAGTLVLARGSVARIAEAMRAAPGPPPAELRHATTDPIVVGTDGSPTAARAVRHAEALAHALGAPLHVVSAYRRVAVGRLREEGSPAPAGARFTIGGRAEADALLARVTNEVSEGVRLETHARTGDPAAALLDVAEEAGAQLIVVGNKGMTGSQRFLLGSVPDRISHHAPCNVLIVRTVD